MKLRPIVWQAGKYNVHKALINKFQIGIINWRVVSTDPNWVARVVVFNRTYKRGFDTLDAAKAWVQSAAQYVLTELLEAQ